MEIVEGGKNDAGAAERKQRLADQVQKDLSCYRTSAALHDDGENIYPREIEERVLQLDSIAEASVAAIKDEKYGEVVGAWLRASGNEGRPSDDEIRQWVRKELAWVKAPQHIFWIGDPGVGDDFPKTASGKHQKHILSERGLKLVQDKAPKAKL